AILNVLQDRALWYRQRLAELQDTWPDMIEEIRGKGFLTGLKLKVPVPDVSRAAMDEQLLTVGAGQNVLRLIPPINVSRDDLNEGLDKLGRAFAHVRSAQAQAS
ncbi:MAG: aminotransferase class III-fold pyridoxal phosphate-dependent enzyme, partial [Pseudomonadota bacterium]